MIDYSCHRTGSYPSQFIKKKKPVNKNSLHTEIHSFSELPNLPNMCSIFQIKSEMLFFMMKYVCNKNYFRIFTWSFLCIKINCRWLWSDQWSGLCLILSDTFVKTCKVATLQCNWRRLWLAYNILYECQSLSIFCILCVYIDILESQRWTLGVTAWM